MDPNHKLRQDIQKFLEVYHFIPAEAKAQFEAYLNGSIKSLDAKTQQLYRALLSAAKDARGIDHAIQALQQASVDGG